MITLIGVYSIKMSFKLSKRSGVKWMNVRNEINTVSAWMNDKMNNLRNGGIISLIMYIINKWKSDLSWASYF